MSEPPLIEFRNARLDVQGSVAAKELTVRSRGTRLALLGDGSAWFRLLLGEAELKTGTVSLLGLPTREALASGRVALISPAHALPGTWRVRALLIEGARLAGLSRAEAEARAEQILRELNLVSLAERRLEALSRVEHRATWVAYAILTWPEVVFVEQLFFGMADHEKQYLWQLASTALAGRKWAIWLPTHESGTVEGAVLAEADEVFLFDQGRLVHQGREAGVAHPGHGLFRVVVAKNAGVFFDKLALAGIDARAEPAFQPSSAPTVGVGGRGVVELPTQDALRTLLSMSLDEEAPILELCPLSRIHFEPS